MTGMRHGELPDVQAVMHWAIRSTPLACGVVTIEVHGTPATDALLRLVADVEHQTTTGTLVVLDLDGLVLTSSRAMRQFIARLIECGIGSKIVLRCTRPTARELLRRWAAGSVPVVGGHLRPPPHDCDRAHTPAS